MGLLRIAYRATTIVATTLLSAALLALLRPFRPLAPQRALVARNTVFRWWARVLCRLFGVRVRVVGRPPRGPFFLVSNHLGYVDIPVLARHLDASFVAKADLRRWPLLGASFAIADTIFIDRGRKRDLLRVMERMQRSLEGGLGLVLFPEGTSGSGREILPFKPPLLDFAASRSLPVRVATIGYRTPPGEPPATEVICWWGNRPFLPHALRLLRLPRFEATLTFYDDEVVSGDRKVLAEALRRRMIESFEPVI